MGAPGLRGAAAPPGGAGLAPLPSPCPASAPGPRRPPGAARDAEAPQEAGRGGGLGPRYLRCRQPALPPRPRLFALSPSLWSEYRASCRSSRKSKTSLNCQAYSTHSIKHGVHLDENKLDALPTLRPRGDCKHNCPQLASKRCFPAKANSPGIGWGDVPFQLGI